LFLQVVEQQEVSMAKRKNDKSDTGQDPLFEMEAEGGLPPTLQEPLRISPFSVLNARSGYWQARKRAWKSLGIQSELGRGEDLAKRLDQIRGK
jgi:hypothetical protein